MEALLMEEAPERDLALERYVLPEIGLLYRAALTITRNRDDAEDLVQETLIRAVRSIGSFDGRFPKAWLLTIMRNAHLNRARKKQPFLFPEADGARDRLASLPGGDDVPEKVVVDDAFDGVVASAFAALPEKLREAVRLVDMDGLSYAEAASVLAVPIGTVMSRLHRGRGRIRNQITQAGIGPRTGPGKEAR